MSVQTISDAETALGHLERLTDVLRGHGWTVEVSAPADRWPSALVANPRMRALNENVIAVLERPGDTWAYYYGWGERIAPCTDVSGAVKALSRVLAVRGEI
ncbi:hypothetical protein AGRA3207_005933 [Actinomadura graeca]|uniref:Uncharacterized protein n=1 Tax=Actinomadura graeca TaxID=2750812 RepID=A0ABX8R4D5_9ACTN|nr:hypothetical protein [Actinomadura graeca]QXJ24582.1 hypothetical protein AGRA3207_005933 [Actinomadura graeca]